MQYVLVAIFIVALVWQVISWYDLNITLRNYIDSGIHSPWCIYRCLRDIKHSLIIMIVSSIGIHLVRYIQ